MLPVAILAGGLATRLHPLTQTIPKSLVPVNGEPFIAHQLRLLKFRGITRIVLCVGHLSERIRDFVGCGDAFGLKVEYSSDGPIPLGTAGALRKAVPFLGDAFFVLYGDSYLPCDFRPIQNFFLDSRKPALMTVYRNEGQFDTSNVEFADGRIVDYDKRAPTPRMRHIDYGLGVFHASVFDSLPVNAYDLATVYSDLLDRNELAAFEAMERFYEAGSFEGIRQLESFLATG